jgi:iron complex outermembrane receptor protein
MAVACALAASVAGAQELAGAGEKITFNIPEQNAVAAVQAWARQSGLQVFAADELLRGLRTQAVRGDYAPLQAMEMLIAGTGLEVVSTGEKTVTLRRPNNGASATTAYPSAGPDLSGLEEIVVTGSRIKRTGFDTLEAALVVGSNEISRRAYTNVGQALEAMPGFFASDSSPVSANQGNNGVGQTFVNFFGLGSQRTLTLVNGRRFVSSNSAT